MLRLFFSTISVSVIIIANSISYPQSVHHNSKYNIDNCLNIFNKENVEKTPAGFQYWFVNKNFIDGRTLKLSVVAPNSSTHPPHYHPEDEFFFIIEGKAEFYLAGKTKIAEGMATFYCPSNVEHGIKNIGDNELKYLVIKKYEK